jgi:hypothetical protein
VFSRCSLVQVNEGGTASVHRMRNSSQPVGHGQEALPAATAHPATYFGTLGVSMMTPFRSVPSAAASASPVSRMVPSQTGNDACAEIAGSLHGRGLPSGQGCQFKIWHHAGIVSGQRYNDEPAIR